MLHFVNELIYQVVHRKWEKADQREYETTDNTDETDSIKKEVTWLVG